MVINLNMQVVMTIVAISSTLTYMPTDPDDPEPPVLQAQPRCLQCMQLGCRTACVAPNLPHLEAAAKIHTNRLPPATQAWLQDFAWTEEEHGRRLAERRLQVSFVSGLLCTAPVASRATSPIHHIALAHAAGSRQAAALRQHVLL